MNNTHKLAEKDRERRKFKESKNFKDKKCHNFCVKVFDDEIEIKTPREWDKEKTEKYLVKKVRQYTLSVFQERLEEDNNATEDKIKSLVKEKFKSN